MSSKSLLVRIMREFGGGGHSIFAPSASARWMACSGSLIAGLFENDETIYEAAEGTVAHGIAEQWLRTDVRPTHLIGTVETITEGDVSHDIPITRSMIDYVQEYVDWCRFEEGEMFTEIRVWFTDLMPRANPDEPDEEPEEFVAQGGTADNIIIRDRTLIVTDLKYGTGVQVFAEGNPQALLYAYGAYRAFADEYEFDRIIIRIAQPRLDHFDTWEITIDELLEFAEYARERIAAAWSLTAPRRASLKGCRFCRAAHNCAAIAYMMECAVGGDVEFLEAEFGEEEMSVLRDALAQEYKFRRAQFGNLTTEQMAKILPYRKVVENWFSRLDFELERRAMNGEKVPGQKLVESRTNRKFANEKDAIALFKFLDIEEDKYIERKLRTPAQMEEVLRDELGVSRAGAPNIIAGIVYKPEGKPTLAPLTDKRPPLDGKYSGAWDDEDDDEV
ncbi:exonuclease [Salmonella phage STP-3]|nr:exonuclease [Salmonella phage STP-3]